MPTSGVSLFVVLLTFFPSMRLKTNRLATNKKFSDKLKFTEIFRVHVLCRPRPIG